VKVADVTPGGTVQLWAAPAHEKSTLVGVAARAGPGARNAPAAATRPVVVRRARPRPARAGEVGMDVDTRFSDMTGPGGRGAMAFTVGA
jgi:hypothetical protein